MEVELAVNIGGTNVPLSELRDIEVGDVTPLDTRVGDPAELEVKDEIIARGRVGTNNGLLALSIHDVCEGLHGPEAGEASGISKGSPTHQR